MTLSRRLWIGAAVATAVVATAIGVRRCDPIPIAPPTDFSYAVHLKPRVFVMHEPLVPAPSQTLRITIAPDIDAPATVTRAVAQLRTSPTGTPAETQCAASAANTFVCEIKLDASEGEQIYSGFVELAGGERVASRGQYRFTVASTLPTSALVAVRVPVQAVSAVVEAYRVDTTLVREDVASFTQTQFLADAHAGIFQGILADPTYRWRDVHLGFWLYTRPGMVSSYYSGLDTRCGKNPWPGDANLPGALAAIEVVGVLHRRTSTTEGIEGTNTAPASVAFRDCAGATVRTPRLGSFSASGGLAESPGIVKHEFGHAAFGLGDEYREDEASRNVVAASVAVLPQSGCCCRNDSGGGGGVVTVPGPGGVTPGGGTVGGGGVPGGPGGPVDTKTCMSSSGQLQTSPALGTEQLPSCTGFTFAQSCGIGPDGGCPSLRGDCVRASAWLGANAPADAKPRPNVFESLVACEKGKLSAADHPAIENVAASLGTCRQLCGPGIGACPCEPSAEYWIVDIDPSTSTVRDDAMARMTSALARHGGTCQWCVETALCVRWHRARGDTPEATWAACSAPPKAATGFEALWRALVEWIGRIIAAILNIFRF